MKFPMRYTYNTTTNNQSTILQHKSTIIMKTTSYLPAFSLALIGFAVAQTINLSAATLVGYNTLGMTGTEATLSATTVASGLSGDNLVRGDGLIGNVGVNSMNASGWTMEITDYFRFGFSVNSGYSATFTGFEFGSRSSAFGPGFIGVYAMVDDGLESLIYTINQSPGTNFVNSRFELSSPLLVSSNLSIYLRQIGTTAANGAATTSGGTFRITDYRAPDGTTVTDVNLFGSVEAVPEPSACGLGAASIAALLLRRPNRIRKAKMDR
jgi:hypothetical protein